MILALDVGNSQIFGGVMVEAALDPKILATFRMSSKVGSSSDEYGLFLRQVLRENGLDSAKLTAIVICSVVPGLMHSLSGACQKYFKIQPLILQAGVKTGLKIKYKNPLEVGADRIANAIAASIRYPKKNLIIIDMGTATTLCAVTANRDYLGGAVLAGLKISMEALESRTAKLPTVEIIAPQAPLGQSTVESIQSGLYFGHVGAMRELTSRVAKQSFGEEPYFVVGTGGFSRLFSHEKLFDVEVPHLVLLGLYDALRMNSEQGPKNQGAPNAANGPDAHDPGRN